MGGSGPGARLLALLPAVHLWKSCAALLGLSFAIVKWDESNDLVVIRR